MLSTVKFRDHVSSAGFRERDAPNKGRILHPPLKGRGHAETSSGTRHVGDGRRAKRELEADLNNWLELAKHEWDKHAGKTERPE